MKMKMKKKSKKQKSVLIGNKCPHPQDYSFYLKFLSIETLTKINIIVYQYFLIFIKNILRLELSKRIKKLKFVFV